MITKDDFIHEVPKTGFGEVCPHCPAPVTHEYNTGSAGEDGPWRIIYNYEVCYWTRLYACKHCILPHIHTHNTTSGGYYDVLAWVVPRVVTGYTSEYGEETTVTCLDCILEAVEKLK